MKRLYDYPQYSHHIIIDRLNHYIPFNDREISLRCFNGPAILFHDHYFAPITYFENEYIYFLSVIHALECYPKHRQKYLKDLLSQNDMKRLSNADIPRHVRSRMFNQFIEICIDEGIALNNYFDVFSVDVNGLSQRACDYLLTHNPRALKIKDFNSPLNLSLKFNRYQTVEYGHSVVEAYVYRGCPPDEREAVLMTILMDTYIDGDSFNMNFFTFLSNVSHCKDVMDVLQKESRDQKYRQLDAMIDYLRPYRMAGADFPEDINFLEAIPLPTFNEITLI